MSAGERPAGMPAPGSAAYNLLQQSLISTQAQRDRQVAQLTRLNELSDRLLYRDGADDPATLFAEAVVDVLDVAVGATWILPPHREHTQPASAVVGARLPGRAADGGPGELANALTEAARGRGPVRLSGSLVDLLPGVGLVEAIACPCVGREGEATALLLAGHTADVAGIVGPISDDSLATLALLAQKLAAHLDSAADWRLIEEQVRQLRESEDRYRMLAENSSDFVLMANRDRIIEWVSPSIEAVLGWRPDQVVGRRTIEFVSTDQWASLEDQWGRSDSGEVVAGRMKARCADGSTRWLARTLRPVRDESGQRLGHVAGYRDVQGEVEAEEALVASSRRASTARRLLHVALDSSPVAFAVHRVRRDEQGAVEGFSVEFANEPALEGRLDVRAAVGRDLAEVFPDARELGIEEDLRGAVQDSRPRRRSFQRMGSEPGAGARHFELFVSRVDDELVAMSFIEVTELRRTQDDLAEARDVAEAASRAKSDFLATVTHELRTPLTTMVSATELLLEGTLAPEQRELALRQRDAARMLLALVNDILDISRIEAGRLELEWLDFDLRELVDRTLGMFATTAQQKSLRLECAWDADVPSRLVGDPVRLQQVLVNLLSNAVKFTAQGGIRVRISARPVGPGSVELAFEVEDSGIGIPPAALDHVLEAFAQASSSTWRVFGGSGLGLSIARRLVHLMDGRMGIDSTEGIGTTVRFTAVVRLPARDLGTEPAGPGEGDLSEPREWRVLLAEDNDVNRLLLTRMLERIGCSVTTAVTGVEAVAAVERLGLGPGFDLVLMDLSMPDMDGVTATARIRALETARPGPAMPILALTANATSDVVARAEAAGMDGFLSKPISLVDLRGAVQAWAGGRGP